MIKGDRTMAPIVHIIYGGQFGSEAKRLFTEFYANQFGPDAIITNALPNSGGFDSDGKKWSALPIGYPCKMMISPGSAIDMDNLKKEMAQLPRGAEVYIHENAAIVQDKHRQEEGQFIRIGSTMTGGAGAVIEKMERNPVGVIVAKDFIRTQCKELESTVLNNSDWLHEIGECERILIICAQGHSLSINYGMYPYCTSRNTSPAQAVADAGIPMQWVEKVIGCFRTFPIRVANRYDEVTGEIIGWSGPCYPDQCEISWEDIDQPKEYTSVSKKVRRLFTFSHHQLKESLIVNGTTDVFLNFMNYIPEPNHEDFATAVEGTIDSANSITGVGARLSFVGFGPTKKDIVSL